MNTEKAEGKRPHQLTLQNRHELVATGVQQVESFNEDAVVLRTDLGELCIRGSGLHIHQLSAETGELRVTGTVSLLSYSEAHTGGFFSRLLK